MQSNYPSSLPGSDLRPPPHLLPFVPLQTILESVESAAPSGGYRGVYNYADVAGVLAFPSLFAGCLYSGVRAVKEGCRCFPSMSSIALGLTS